MACQHAGKGCERRGLLCANTGRPCRAEANDAAKATDRPPKDRMIKTAPIKK